MVEAVPGDDDGLGWRTRVQWAVDPDRPAGLRSTAPTTSCPSTTARSRTPGCPTSPAPSGRTPPAVEAIVSTTGEQLRLVTTRDGGTFADGPLLLHEQAAGRDWQVTGSGFWQVHPGAADALVGAVLDGLRAAAGGAGARPLRRRRAVLRGAGRRRSGRPGTCSPSRRTPSAAEDAAANLADLPQVSVVAAQVDRALCRRSRARRPGGARPAAHRREARGGRGDRGLAPRAVAYVACDPAALARDVAFFAEHGYG